MTKSSFLIETIVALCLVSVSFNSFQAAKPDQVTPENGSGQSEPADQNPRTVYLSTGDSQHLLDFPPLDSRATIETAFESLQRNYQVSRIWWRGGQDEVWGKQFVLREANRHFAQIWKWWKDLAYEKVGTNRIAVRAAHDRGMEIWMAYGLFDNGSSADVGYMDFPYAMEDRLRVAHPEWAPVNKYGTWRQGGPIAFCYPGARKVMADYLTKYVVEGGYDGIAFLTYAENYSQRYEDEFLQVRAARTLISLLRLLESQESREQALGEVLAFFRQYGEDCTRCDADWGWRVVGNGLLGLGTAGRNHLASIMADKSDRRLAEIAWRIVYMPQGDQLFRITDEQDQEAHRHHPFRP